jgi:Ca2+-binding EF-hand superfamily protein
MKSARITIYNIDYSL